MNTIDNIKNGLIDRILATNNEKLLEAIRTIFESSREEELIHLSSEQIEMLSMSQDDIVNNRLLSEEDIRNTDPEWLL
nr:hypothetical protein [uncultured Flavobacterium sp.]